MRRAVECQNRKRQTIDSIPIVTMTCLVAVITIKASPSDAEERIGLEKKGVSTKISGGGGCNNPLRT